jgi:hypothetical protein
MKFLLSFLAIGLFSLGSPGKRAPIPNKKGYAIFPSHWAFVLCHDDRLSYKISGCEQKRKIPSRIQKFLQKEYEKLCKPSKEAQVGDLKKYFGPLNLLKEKTHTLWIFPVHQGEQGYALVFMQKKNGHFEAGHFSLGLSSEKES